MTDRHVPAHSELLQERLQRESQRRHRRLANFGGGEPPFRFGGGFRVKEAAQRSADAAVQIGDGVVEPIEAVAEGGNLLVRLAQQADLLRALAGKEQADLLAFERSLREHGPRKKLAGGGGRGGSHRVRGAITALLQGFRAGNELLAERLERVRHHRQPGLRSGAPGERVRDVGQRASFAPQRGDGRRQLPGGLRHQRGPRAGEQEELRARFPRRGQAAALRNGLRGLLQDEVRVRAAKSEGADSSPSRRSVGLPGQRGPGQEEGASAQLELGVLVEHTRLRRQRAVMERKDGLDEPGDPRGGHRVTDVAFDAAKRGVHAVARGPAGFLEQRPEGAHLDQVADGGGGAVRLHVSQGRRRDSRVPVRHPQRL